MPFPHAIIIEPTFVFDYMANQPETNPPLSMNPESGTSVPELKQQDPMTLQEDHILRNRPGLDCILQGDIEHSSDHLCMSPSFYVTPSESNDPEALPHHKPHVADVALNSMQDKVDLSIPQITQREEQLRTSPPEVVSSTTKGNTDIQSVISPPPPSEQIHVLVGVDVSNDVVPDGNAMHPTPSMEEPHASISSQ
jgi:hypothetical protein